MYHHGAVGGVEIRLLPHILVDHLHREDALGALHEQPQDLVLRLGQVDLLPIHPDAVAVQRQLHAMAAQGQVLGPGRGLPLALIDAVPPQQCLDPGAELRKGKGLGQIIVPARGQAQQLIGLL